MFVNSMENVNLPWLCTLVPPRSLTRQNCRDQTTGGQITYKLLRFPPPPVV
eukprot:UN19425